MAQSFYKMDKSVFKLVGSGEISLVAANIHMLIIDRIKYSKFKKNEDKFAIFTLKQLGNELNVKDHKTIYKAVNELIERKLITAKKSKGAATKYFLNRKDN